MGGGQMKTPRGWRADTGQDGRLATAAGHCEISQDEGRAKRPRPRGFAPWNPRSESLALVRDVQTVLDEYREYLPLTIRQAFYRLVAIDAWLLAVEQDQPRARKSA